MFAFIINNFPAVAVVVPVLLFIFAALHSAHVRQVEAAKAAALEAERIRKAEAAEEKRRFAEEMKRAAQAAREREAVARKAEQQRKREEKEAARAVREAEQQRRQAEKLEASRILAEYNERALQAARELRKLAATPVPAPEAATAPSMNSAKTEAAQAPAKRAETVSYNSPFAGQIVSFTGKLQSMKRADAIKAVQAAGGRAYADFPAGTTLLVVGINPGEKKQEKFDRWIGQVKKITEAQFIEMLKGA